MAKKSDRLIGYLNTLSYFTDVQKLVEDKNTLSKKLKQVKRKLRTKKQYYDFLIKIVAPKNDLDLERYLRNYFLAFGYKKVVWLGKNLDREDLQIWTKDRVILIEVKNISGDNIKRKDIQQLEWRRNLVKDNKEFKGYELRFLMIANHENEIFPIDNRKNIPLDRDKVTYLLNSDLGFITTKELYFAYINFKINKLTFKELDSAIIQKGAINIKQRE